MNTPEELVWAVQSLFARGATPGTTGNISMYEQGTMLMSSCGSCFGMLDANALCKMNLDGRNQNGPAPSKEWPLHAKLHSIRMRDGVVIHTHGFYTAAWSCLPCENPADALPSYTPYLKMKAGRVKYVPYAKPGSEKLFQLFDQAVEAGTSVYLLAHHGAIVVAEDVLSAMNLIEETETSAHLAMLFRDQGIEQI